MTVSSSMTVGAGKCISTLSPTAQLQAWSTTQGAFCDARYFGRIVFAETDVWCHFFNAETSCPAPVAYKAEPNRPWKLTRGAITAGPEQDSIHYSLKCPETAPEGRVYAGVTFTLKPPVDVSRHPYAELVFTKVNPDVMLELIYGYVDADGKEDSNYFLPSRWGDGTPVPQVFIGRLDEGHQRDRPHPKLLKTLTVYSVVKGGKTPMDCDFSLRWLRICSEPLYR